MIQFINKRNITQTDIWKEILIKKNKHLFCMKINISSAIFSQMKNIEESPKLKSKRTQNTK